MKKFLSLIMISLFLCSITGFANADLILSPVSAVIDSSGPGFGSIEDTFNHNGLVTDFTSGVDDFDTYIATNPLHDWIFAGNEWFSNSGTTTATVTYYLGGLYNINRLALWNDEASGIGLLDLTGSTDGSTFFSFASGLTPTDNFAMANYGADVFPFSTTTVQYVRFNISNSPQPLRDESTPFPSAAIGEVAFAGTPIPEPTTLLLLGSGLIGLAGFIRRFKKK